MQRLLRFLRQYKLFSVALVTGVIGLILELSGKHSASHWLLSIVIIIEVMPLLWDMWQHTRHGSYGIDILAITAIVTAIILGQYWAALTVVLMLTGGETLENFAHRRAQGELSTLLKHAPQQAHVVRKGKTLDLPVNEVKVGDRIIVKAGEIVPVDAIIVEGNADFDEASLTGEALPQTKQAGDQLLSGSINLDGAVTAKATAAAHDSQYQQIIKLVRAAVNSRAPFVRLADRYSLPFTFLAFAIASAVWIFSGQAIRFLEVIVVATPCPLILAAPIALISGMAKASRYGIIVKTGTALERLAEAQTFAFDKTGTLTRGELVVDKILVSKNFSKDEVLGLAASAEQASNHIVAHAIVAGARAQDIKLAKAKQVREIAGRGLQVTLKAKVILVGNASLMTEHSVVIPTKFTDKNVSQTAVYLAVDGELAGALFLKDEIRPEAHATLSALEAMGIHNMLMVTGDNKASALNVAKQLGISEVYADALPADKLRILSSLENPPVAFVGDGVNDAPILTAADVGIALGARGSTAASESADMVILPDDIGRVADATKIARHTFKIARQSILYGIGLSLVLMLIFATGKFSPLTGAILQEAVDVVVIFNALRAHRLSLD